MVFSFNVTKNADSGNATKVKISVKESLKIFYIIGHQIQVYVQSVKIHITVLKVKIFVSIVDTDTFFFWLDT